MKPEELNEKGKLEISDLTEDQVDNNTNCRPDNYFKIEKARVIIEALRLSFADLKVKHDLENKLRELLV